MATNRKYQNISIQPTKLPRSSKTIFELPRHTNLTEAELFRKSTSDRTKRRVAHKAWFPLPVITKPVVPVRSVAQRKQKKKHVLKKEGCMSRLFLKPSPCKLRQIKTFALDSASAQLSHSTNSSIEVDDRVKANKRKSGDLNCDGVTKKKQKNGIVDKPKNKDVTQEKKLHPHKGIDDGVKADKSKSGDLDCDEVATNKQKKCNVDKSKNIDLRREKTSRPRKGIDDGVKDDKSKSVNLDCDNVAKKKKKNAFLTNQKIKT